MPEEKTIYLSLNPPLFKLFTLFMTAPGEKLFLPQQKIKPGLPATFSTAAFPDKLLPWQGSVFDKVRPHGDRGTVGPGNLLQPEKGFQGR